MSDPYTILGVPPGAGHDEVRRAYRARAKSEHPDAGGDHTRFALIKLAHDTLTDAKRSAAYEATGKMEEPPPDQRRARTMQYVAMAVNGVFSMCQQKQCAPTTVDFVQSIRDALGLLITESKKKQAEMRRAIAEAESLDGRFSAKKGKTDILSTMMRARVSEAEAALRLEAECEALMHEAVKVVADHRFRADEAAATGYFVVQQIYGGGGRW